MTKKRFTLKKYTIEDYAILDDGTEIAYASNKSAFTFCELLNELHEENERLYDEIFRLRTELAYDRTEKEEHSDSVYDFIKKLEKW